MQHTFRTNLSNFFPFLSSVDEDNSHNSDAINGENDLIATESAGNAPVVEKPLHKFHQVDPHKSKPSLGAQISFSIQFILFASQVELSDLILSTLRECRYGYMFLYPWIHCTSSNGEYVALVSLAGAFVLVYLVGVPLLFIAQLVYYRKRILNHDILVEYRVGFLYETFKPQVFWFEAVWLARRTLISICLSVISSRFVSSSLLMLILIASLAIQRHVLPFASVHANFLELFSTSCLLLSFSVANFLPEADNSISVSVGKVLMWVVNVLITAALFLAILAPALNKALRKCAACSCKKRHHVE